MGNHEIETTETTETTPDRVSNKKFFEEKEIMVRVTFLLRKDNNNVTPPHQQRTHQKAHGLKGHRKPQSNRRRKIRQMLTLKRNNTVSTV